MYGFLIPPSNRLLSVVVNHHHNSKFKSPPGWVKLTDMGLAKVVVSKTFTTCGTPDYFAPEVIQQTGMGKGVDWWTLGVLTHELMSGHAPFEANDPMETYQKIVRGVNRVRFT